MGEKFIPASLQKKINNAEIGISAWCFSTKLKLQHYGNTEIRISAWCLLTRVKLRETKISCTKP